MREAIRHVFTGGDNQTTEIGRVLLAFFSLAIVVQHALAIWIHGQQFDVMSTATAYGALLVAGCGAIRIKAATEPGAKQ